MPQAHPYNLQQAIERFERGYIANILELTRWNRRKTAQMLEIFADALTAKMQYYQLLSSPASSHSCECCQNSSIYTRGGVLTTPASAKPCKESEL